jgi:hypothetical protein
MAKYLVNWRLEHDGAAYEAGGDFFATPDDAAHLVDNGVLTYVSDDDAPKAATKGRKAKGAADAGEGQGDAGDGEG